MIGWTNMADGGINIQNNKAVIHVLAPIGSTINFLKDGIAIALKPDKSFVDITRNDFAHWYYSISPSNYGEWTVTATLGTDTDSDTVIVDDNKEYEVELIYVYWIHMVGKGLAAGFTASSVKTFVSNANAITMNESNDVNGVIINPAISLADYQYCKFEYTKQDSGYNGSGSTNSGRFGFTNQNTVAGRTAINWTAFVKPDPTGYDVWQTATIDISQLSGSFYFTFCCWNNKYEGIRNLRLTKS